MNETNEINFSDVKNRFPVEYFFEGIMGQDARTFHSSIRYKACPDPNCGASKDPASLRVVITKKAGMSRWRCYACDKSGDILDAATLYYGGSVKDAAAQLIGKLPATVRNVRVKPKQLLSENAKRDDEAIHAIIKRLIAAKLPMANQVKHYLNSRGFSDRLINEAVRRGMLISLPSQANQAKDALYDICGTELLQRAGMLRDGSKAPACAFRHFAFITHNARAIEFRLTRAPKENETKWISYGPMSPFFWQGEQADSYIITEGMSDVLSAVGLGAKPSIIGLPGCRRWNPYWFTKMKGKTVTLALDADTPGITAVNGKDDQEIARIEDEGIRLRAMGLKRTLEHFGANVKIFQFDETFLAATEDSQKDLNGYLKWLLKSKGKL